MPYLRSTSSLCSESASEMVDKVLRSGDASFLSKVEEFGKSDDADDTRDDDDEHELNHGKS